MKKIYFLALCVCIGSALFAKSPETVKVAAPFGAPAVTLSKMATENPSLVKNVTTKYEIVGSPDLMQARVISGEADIAIVPTNLAAVLYAKKVPIQYAGSVVWGILYGVTTENLHSVEDLRGKTLTLFGRGLTPDITVREILLAAGLKPDVDVTLEYLDSSSVLAPSIIAGKTKIAIAPEPMLSMILTKKKDAKVFINFQTEWANRVGQKSSYPQASVIIRKDLIQKNPKYVKAFFKEFEKSLAWVNKNPAKAGEYATKLADGMPPAKIIAKAIPNMNIYWKNAKDARSALETYFKILEKTNPKFIGGALPKTDFYYNSK